jgi:tyrosine-protein kinase Etk/Wzc
MNDSLTPDAPEDEISLLDLLQVVVDNLRLLLVGSLGAGLLALGVSFLITPMFTAKTQFLPPQQQQSSAASLLSSLGALGGLAGAATGIKNPSDQFLAYMKSVSVQDALIERFKLMERYKKKYKDEVRKELASRSRITSGKDGLIAVEVDDHDPQFAADLANAHVEELQKLLGRLALTEAQQRRAFFEKQLNQTKDNLIKSEQALRTTGVNSSALKSSPAAAVEAVARLKAMISAQEVKLASMRGYLTESSSDFKQALNELSVFKTQLSKAEQEEPASASTSDYVARYRDYKYNETLFELFAKQYELARVDESREGSAIQVVDVAQPPERKSKPKKALIAIIATLAAGFALLLWVFVRQALKNASASPETAEKLQTLRMGWRRALGLKG